MMGVLLSASWLMVGCSVIDDDLSDCYEEEPQATVDYELKLVTNMTTELTTQLTTQTDVQLSNALKQYLNDWFAGREWPA